MCLKGIVVEIAVVIDQLFLISVSLLKQDTDTLRWIEIKDLSYLIIILKEQLYDFISNPSPKTLHHSLPSPSRLCASACEFHSQVFSPSKRLIQPHATSPTPLPSLNLSLVPIIHLWFSTPNTPLLAPLLVPMLQRWYPTPTLRVFPSSLLKIQSHATSHIPPTFFTPSLYSWYQCCAFSLIQAQEPISCHITRPIMKDSFQFVTIRGKTDNQSMQSVVLPFF